jgi:exonuclease VII small subunit
VSEFQQKLVDGGNQLKQLSQELLEFLRSNLNDEHNARRGELEQLRTMFTAESSRLHELTEHLDSRIAKLSDSVRSLESGLDQRLNQMCGRAVSDTRSQLESAAGAILTDLTTRSTQALGNQLDETGANMRNIQKGIVASVSESLEIQTRDALQEFEQSVEDMARASVERWRQKLAGGLSALSKSLDEQLQS